MDERQRKLDIRLMRLTSSNYAYTPVDHSLRLSLPRPLCTCGVTEIAPKIGSSGDHLESTIKQ
ncbi:hypothetical protein J6590_100538 [Homalodisca vitripennis]|nr:hypothetical protein J6590_100538 [Homalodisca vitripennis]